MRKNLSNFGFILLLVLPLAAASDPIEERDELMEETRDAIKPMGQMAKGERDFDADVVAAGLETMQRVASEFGDLFPAGTETGGGTEAKSTIWTDREGFNEALDDFASAVEAGMLANPQNVEELRPVLGAIGKSCKSCHDGYRVKDD